MQRVRWIAGAWLAAVCWLMLATTTPACPFCSSQGTTLIGEVNTASMVLFGKFHSADEKNETVQFDVEEVIKDHAARGKAKTITLARYVDPSLAGDKDRHLIFCDIFKGKIDPYRGMVLKSGTKLPAYLRGALEVKDKAIDQKLRFYFDYLDDADSEISNDAYKEFGNADYKDFQGMAKDLKSERVISWLKNPETPSFRMGLYASMLGHCGKEKDAVVLKTLLADPERKTGTGVDGIMAGYAMLRPKEGWNHIVGLLKNDKEDFMARYAALRALRFLYDYRSDVVTKKQLVEGLCVMLTQDDISDLAIEDLRKWKCWEKADLVLAVAKSEAYKQPIVRRAVLRFALQAKESKAATAYVAARRKADAKAVEEAEELLKLEQDTTAKSDGAVTKGK